MTANGDETYLEAVVEQCLPALPYQIKRNLELIQSLDRSCAADALQLRQLHEQYLLISTRSLRTCAKRKNGSSESIFRARDQVKHRSLTRSLRKGLEMESLCLAIS
jgi:hypothetical protein